MMLRYSLLLLLLPLSSCSSGAVVSQINSAKAASGAMAELDTNKDGLLESGELQACPGLLSAIKYYDTNGDKKLSEEELRTRFQGLIDTQVGQVSFDLIIQLNDQPLSGATVKMIPCNFLKDYLKPAEAVTDGGGMASMRITPSDPVVYYGIYSVEVSKLMNGKETIPTRFNTKTTLGCEVGKENRGQPVILKIKSP